MAMTPEQRATLPLMRVALYSKAGEPIDWAAVRADIEQHIREAVAAEREACAKVADSYVDTCVTDWKTDPRGRKAPSTLHASGAAMDIAADIRARQ